MLSSAIHLRSKTCSTAALARRYCLVLLYAFRLGCVDAEEGSPLRRLTAVAEQKQRAEGSFGTSRAAELDTVEL